MDQGEWEGAKGKVRAGGKLIAAFDNSNVVASA